MDNILDKLIHDLTEIKNKSVGNEGAEQASSDNLKEAEELKKLPVDKIVTGLSDNYKSTKYSTVVERTFKTYIFICC